VYMFLGDDVINIYTKMSTSCAQKSWCICMVLLQFEKKLMVYLMHYIYKSSLASFDIIAI